MELRGIADDLARAGIALFAVSYDSVTTLASFGAKHRITYPLLSDEGSQTLRQLGMVDDDLDRHAAEFGRVIRDDQRGVAYPAVLVLDQDGIVVEKRLHRNYRIRDTGTGLLEAALQIATPARGLEAAARDGTIQVRAHFDAPVYRPYQQLRMTLTLEIAEGWHVYAEPVPPGYTALFVEIEPVAGLEVEPVTWPIGRSFRVTGLGEEFRVLDGTVRVTVPVTFAATAGRGDVTVDVTIRYQACSQTLCLPPAIVRCRLPVREAPLAE